MKPIPSAPGYFATDFGTIVRNGRSMRGASNGRGYLRVKLSINNVQRDDYVHRLVCEAYHGPCPSGHQCRHLDGNSKNNIPDNLAWGTREENMADRYRHGTIRIGTKHHRSILTEQQVLTARERARSGERVDLIAADMELPYKTLLDAVVGRRYPNLPSPVTDLPKGMQRRQAEARAKGIKLPRNRMSGCTK